MEWSAAFFLRIINKNKHKKKKKRKLSKQPIQIQLSFNLLSEPIGVSVQDERSWPGLLEIAVSDRSQGSLFLHLNGVAEKQTQKEQL